MTISAPTHSPTDPRPVVVFGADGPRLLGGRCVRCAHPSATTAPRCPRCGGESTQARFGPDGVVWATTTIRVANGDRAAPYTLAYVDLDDGPRVLSHVLGAPDAALSVGERVGVGERVRVGDRVRLVELTDHGDPQIDVIP